MAWIFVLWKCSSHFYLRFASSHFHCFLIMNWTTKGRTGDINYMDHCLQKSYRKWDTAGVFCELGQWILICKEDLNRVSHRLFICYTKRKRKTHPVHIVQPTCLCFTVWTLIPNWGLWRKYMYLLHTKACRTERSQSAQCCQDVNISTYIHFEQRRRLQMRAKSVFEDLNLHISKS